MGTPKMRWTRAGLVAAALGIVFVVWLVLPAEGTSLLRGPNSVTLERIDDILSMSADRPGDPTVALHQERPIASRSIERADLAAPSVPSRSVPEVRFDPATRALGWGLAWRGPPRLTSD
jgi:hypothetical protein